MAPERAGGDRGARSRPQRDNPAQGQGGQAARGLPRPSRESQTVQHRHGEPESAIPNRR